METEQSEEIIITGFLDGIKPEPRIDLAEWSDSYRILSQVASAEHGPWRTSRVPYMREIMEKLSVGDPTQEIVLMKGSQLAFTEIGCNWIGYVIDVAPGPMLAVMPTEGTMKKNSRLRIDPLIMSTPRLREKVVQAKSRDKGNTMLQKDFSGGTLMMVGANAPAGLSSVPVRYLFLDEVDRYPLDAGDEGSPIDLARARTQTFSRRKILIGSTPTMQGASAIEDEFENTDQRKYYVPCPHCDLKQVLVFANLQYSNGDPETTQYFCEGCGAGIEERHKIAMLAGGEWRMTKPENESRLKSGYWISSLYSPWKKWREVIADWLAAQGKTSKLKTFVNTILGETWKDKGEAPPWEDLYNRREGYKAATVPDGVYFLTAGVDVQKDRFEMEIVGWGKNKESWSIDYRVIPADPALASDWNKVAAILNETFKRADGMEFKIMSMGVDTGYATTDVYSFIKKHPGRAYAMKGSDKSSVIISAPKATKVAKSGKRIKAEVKLWMVGVSLLKGELYGWLNLKIGEDGIIPEGYCHFPVAYDHAHFKSLTAERLQLVKNKKGFSRYEWVKLVERNERLDCRVYARAAAAINPGIDRFTLDSHYEAMMAFTLKHEQSVQTSPQDSLRRSIWKRD